MIYSKDPEIEKAAKLVDAALVEYHSRHQRMVKTHMKICVMSQVSF